MKKIILGLIIGVMCIGCVSVCILVFYGINLFETPAANIPVAKEKTYKIGTVDLNRVADNYEKHKEVIEGLEKEILTLREDLSKLEAKMLAYQEQFIWVDDPRREDEYNEFMEKILPKLGDTYETAVQKTKNLETMINNAYNARVGALKKAGYATENFNTEEDNDPLGIR